MTRDDRYKSMKGNLSLGEYRVKDSNGQRQHWVWYDAGIDALHRAFADDKIAPLN